MNARSADTSGRAKAGRVYTSEHPTDRLCPGYGVELFDVAIERGMVVASKIHKVDTEAGYRMRTSNEPTFMSHYRGCLSEIAGHVLTGLAWPGSWKWDPRRADIGAATEVRSNWFDYVRRSMGTRAPLVIYPGDLKYKSKNAHMLAWPLDEEFRRWWFRGWLIADDATRDEWHTLRMGKDACWEVPPAYLNCFPVPECR